MNKEERLVALAKEAMLKEDQLSAVLTKIVGAKVVAHIDNTMNRQNQVAYYVNSDSLDRKDFGLFACTMKSVVVESFNSIWYDTDRDALFFRPHLSYQHLIGGSNGHEIADADGNSIIVMYSQERGWYAMYAPYNE